MSIVANSGAVVHVGEWRRPGGRPADVMSDLCAARTATRSGQCRESRYPPRRSRAAKRALCGVREELMSSRVRQDEPPGRSRQRLIANLNETPRPACRLNFRLTFLSFVYFGKRPLSHGRGHLHLLGVTVARRRRRGQREAANALCRPTSPPRSRRQAAERADGVIELRCALFQTRAGE